MTNKALLTICLGFTTLTSGCSSLGLDINKETFQSSELDSKECHQWNKNILALEQSPVLKISRLLDKHIGCIKWPLKEALVDDYIQKHNPENLSLFNKELSYANSAVNKELLWFRAQVAVSMFTRYGVARIDDYLEDGSAESYRLIEAVTHAETNIINTLSYLEKDNYALERAHSFFSIIEVAAAAVDPSLRRSSEILKQLSNPTSISGAVKSSEKVLRNLFRNIIYLNAYQDAFSKTAKDVSVLALAEHASETEIRTQLREGWKWALDDLNASCNRSKQLLHKNLSGHLLSESSCISKENYDSLTVAVE